MALESMRGFKAKLRGGGLVFGPWLGIPDPNVVELMARPDFDFLLMDGEHSPISPQQLAGLLPSADVYRRPVIYRPPSQDPAGIKMALDAGAAGVMVPMVETADQARAIVEVCKYPPQGRRGIGPWRASGYYGEFDTYLAEANEAVATVVQIETSLGLANAEAIAAVEGVDVLFVGPADLAASLGLPVGVQSDRLLEAFARVAAATRTSGKIAAIDLIDAERLPRLRSLGFSLFTIGSDMSFIQHCGTALLAELARMNLDAGEADPSTTM